MRNTFGKWKRLDGFFRAFLILAVVFLAIGLGTLGSVRGTGKAYELRSQLSGDEQRPSVVFRLSNLTQKGEDGETETVNLRLMGVSVNVAAIYGADGTSATLRIERRTSSGTSFSSALDATFDNIGFPTQNGVEDGLFRFVSPFALPDEGWRVSLYPYVRLSVSSCNVLINEVVFLGEKLDSDYKGTGEMCVIPASIHEATPYANESVEQSALRAGALLDAQQMPSSSMSSFVRYKNEEIPVLQTIAEMRMGGQYAADNNGGATDTYRIDTASGALGIDFLALGTRIFGMSPFGLRFFPMLFAFVALVAFSRLTARLMKSERAGFAFALLFALSCLTLGLGQLGIPLMIAIGFFAVSLDLVHRFYQSGCKASPLGVLPLFVGGLCSAAAICVYGPFAVPAAGVTVLFILALVRQKAVGKYRVGKALKAAPAEGVPAEGVPAESAEGGGTDGEARAAQIAAEFRYKDRATPVCFFAGLLLGTLLLALLGMLPAYFVYLKYYAGPQNTANIFVLAWHSFANGFTGNYGVGRLESWNFFHILYRGSGTLYAVTGLTVNLAAMAAALVGVGIAAVRLALALFHGEKGKARRAEIRACAIPLVGFLISVAVAAALPYAPAFLTLAYLFAFMLGAKGWSELKKGAAYKTVGIMAAVFLTLFFLLSAAFVFSIPLPAAFMDAIF